jgi:hypothetical protein
MSRILAACGATLLIAGCSSANEVADLGSNDAAAPADMAITTDRPPTDHPPLPTITNHGGPVLAAPEVWTVVWSDELARGQSAHAFYTWLLKSSYFTDSLAEYGVHAGEAKGVLTIEMPAPATFEGLSLEAIADSLAARPEVNANPNTVLAFQISQKTNLTSLHTPYCGNIGSGYHGETHKGLVYTVNIDCPEGTGDPLTEVYSHEVAEAATNPHPTSTAGTFFDDDFWPGEIGDLCYILPVPIHATLDVPDAGPTASDFTVTRVYSQKAAAMGNVDPCVPAPADTPFFNVGFAPRLVTVMTDSKGAGTATTQLEPFSYGDVGMVKWRMYGMPEGLTISPDSGSARPGDTVAVTITIAPAFKPQTYAAGIFVQTKSDTGARNLSTLSVYVP